MFTVTACIVYIADTRQIFARWHVVIPDQAINLTQDSHKGFFKKGISSFSHATPKKRIPQKNLSSSSSSFIIIILILTLIHFVLYSSKL